MELKTVRVQHTTNSVRNFRSTDQNRIRIKCYWRQNFWPRGGGAAVCRQMFTFPLLPVQHVEHTSVVVTVHPVLSVSLFFALSWWTEVNLGSLKFTSGCSREDEHFKAFIVALKATAGVNSLPVTPIPTSTCPKTSIAWRENVYICITCGDLSSLNSCSSIHKFIYCRHYPWLKPTWNQKKKKLYGPY